MKTIRLTPQQWQDIGERRRHAPDRRIYQRTSAVLWSDQGRSREEIADLLGVSTRQVARNDLYSLAVPVLPTIGDGDRGGTPRGLET